jgi:hypothetical protein
MSCPSLGLCLFTHDGYQSKAVTQSLHLWFIFMQTNSLFPSRVLSNIPPHLLHSQPPPLTLTYVPSTNNLYLPAHHSHHFFSSPPPPITSVSTGLGSMDPRVPACGPCSEQGHAGETQVPPMSSLFALDKALASLAVTVTGLLLEGS